MNDSKTISDYFREAVIACIETKQWGSQIIISEKTGINRSHLNQFLKGKKKSSEKMRVKLSECIGFKYEELVMLGRMLAELSESEKEHIKLFSENINYELYQKIRMQSGYSIEAFASMIGVPLLKYRFKEKGILPFMIGEIRAIMNFTDNRNKIDKKFNKVSEIIEEAKGIIDKKIKDLSKDEKNILKILLKEEFTDYSEKIDKAYDILRMVWEKSDNMPNKKSEKIL